MQHITGVEDGEWLLLIDLAQVWNLEKRWIPLKADGNYEWNRFLPETRRNDIMKDGFPMTTVGNDPCGFYGRAVS
jgi:hypothetical protein